MLDRKEEERQSKDLLRLYLKAMEQEGTWDPQEESRNMFHMFFSFTEHILRNLVLRILFINESSCSEWVPSE